MGEDTTMIVHADVYTYEIPSTSNSVMMSSGDSSLTEKPEASVSLTSFDTLDDARPRKDAATTSKKSVSLNEENVEAIEMMPIMETTLSTPEPNPKIMKNGLDVDTKNSAPEHVDSACDTCILDCIYVTQRCCECTII